ncbi:MAG: hypothetical protein M4D80_30230 [Myxococcota bacterium]|nr:hypothetical protein [Myxococcota bacterium]
MMWMVIACSGPGAMAAIERNEAWGWKMFAIAGLVAIAVVSFAIVKKRASIWLWLTIGTTVVHPAVWMGARSGDCGHMLYFASIFATVQAALFGVIAVLKIRSERRDAIAR